ncbi:hypothetical protein ACM7HL_12805 [Pseudomonas aeruginosa]
MREDSADLDDDKTFGAGLRAERERLGLELHELAHLRRTTCRRRCAERMFPSPTY